MCGITGYFAFTEAGQTRISEIEQAVQALELRGPDGHGIFRENSIALGHARLSILDVSEAASQPFYDPSERYVLVFNGEIFNFQEHRDQLIQEGVQLKSTGDTEVLMHLLIREGIACLERLNGFFAFAFYDRQEESVLLVRDRYGEKPLLVFKEHAGIAFASEMKSILAFGVTPELDETSLRMYCHLNYIPGPESIFKSVLKVKPGNWMKINRNSVEEGVFYLLENQAKLPPSQLSYSEACDHLVSLMDQAVQRRMISDVPLGAFLSGGIDSSVVVALASKYTNSLHTYSIGYSDEPLFDETSYAKLVAERYQTNHTVFSLKNSDLFSHLQEVLNALDEPFADSSALAVYILCKETRKHVTVALSGDGADELFGGYRKHQAEWRIRQGGLSSSFVTQLQPLWNLLPGSRNNKFGDLVRKLRKYSAGASLTEQERYWSWCGYGTEEYLNTLLNQAADPSEYKRRKNYATRFIGQAKGMNDMLLNDMSLVLPGDMLTKVDLMSMANSLEVRPPFLDVDVVDFALSLPSEYKVDGHGRKKIVQDAFRSMLPEALYNRPKHGFEVPLLSWFRNELDEWIFQDLLEKTYLQKQGIFQVEAIQSLRKQLHSANPGDSTARIWALIVFQSWWRKWMN